MPATIRKGSRNTRVVDAITTYETARGRFLDLAVDSAEFQGDPQFDQGLESAEANLKRAERELVSFLVGCKPIVYNSAVYQIARGGQSIARSDVQVIA